MDTLWHARDSTTLHGGNVFKVGDVLSNIYGFLKKNNTSNLFARKSFVPQQTFAFLKVIVNKLGFMQKR
jgi:hypothetical protein